MASASQGEMCVQMPQNLLESSSTSEGGFTNCLIVEFEQSILS